MYVADMFQKSVTVLAPDGKVLRKIGRPGSGPGEFRAVRDVQVLPGDSLLVYDPELARVSVFAADSSRPAYVVNLADRLPGMAPFHLRRAPATGAYLAQFQARFAFANGTLEPRRDSLLLLNPDGSVRARVASFAPAPFLVARTSITPHPFGRRVVARLDSRGRILFVATDSLAVTTYSPSGAREGSFGYRYDPPPVTQEDAGRALEQMGGEQGKQMFGAALADSLPARWPAVADVRVDDRDRVWIALSASPSQPVEWAVFSDRGRYLRSVMFPAGTTLHAIRAGRAYADRKNEAGVPRVLVFDVHPAF
jgi:hypothetical protein